MAAIKSLSRRQAAVIFQLHTGHVPLNSHLHCIFWAPVHTCPACRAAPKMVHHFLLLCLAFVHAWSQFLSGLGHCSRDLSALLSMPDAFRPLFIMIDEVQNQSFIMGWTSCHWPVMLVDVHGKIFQTQKAFDYKKLDSQLQNLLLCQHSFRVRVTI